MPIQARNRKNLNTDDATKLAGENPHHLFVVSLLGAPGFHEFLHDLDSFFDDGSRDLEVLVIDWPVGASVSWGVIAMPRDYLRTAEGVARSMGASLSVGHKILIHNQRTGEDFDFPLQGKNVYVLGVDEAEAGDDEGGCEVFPPGDGAVETERRASGARTVH